MGEERFGRLVFVPGKNKGRYPFCNSLYIDDERKAVIDTACDESILRDLAEERGLDIIINTHYHEDHFTLNYLFPEAELYVHEDDAPCFTSIDTLFDYYGLTGTEFEQTWRELIVNQFHYRERTPSVEFKDGDILDFGNVKLEVIHTPGHTIGHSSFFCAEEGVLFMGDLDLTPFGPYYGDRDSDIDQTIESVRRLMNIQAEFYITSHEMGIIEGDITGLAEAYLDVIDERENMIMEFLGKPRTLKEIVDQWFVYNKPREPKEFYLFCERAIILKHLERLIKKGRAAIRCDSYFLL
jgi:hydroxyacylglutathione hydrolase